MKQLELFRVRDQCKACHKLLCGAGDTCSCRTDVFFRNLHLSFVYGDPATLEELEEWTEGTLKYMRTARQTGGTGG